MDRPLIFKKDVLELYKNSGPAVAKALGISRQGVSFWGRYLPELQARKILAMHPKIPHRWAKEKRIRKPRREPVQAAAD